MITRTYFTWIYSHGDRRSISNFAHLIIHISVGCSGVIIDLSRKVSNKVPTVFTYNPNSYLVQTGSKSEASYSSFRTQDLIPSRNWWITSIICGGTPKRANTCQRRVRSTQSCTFCRSMEYSSNSATRAILPRNSCSAFGPQRPYIRCRMMRADLVLLPRQQFFRL